METTVEENDSAVPIAQMHMLHFKEAGGVDSCAGVGKLRGDDVKAPQSRKALTGIVWFLKEAQGIRYLIEKSKELRVGTLGL